MVMLVIALIETLYEHKLIASDDPEKCFIINRVSTVALLFVAMPTVLVWILLIGLSGKWSATMPWVVLIAGMLFCCTLSYFWTRMLSNKGKNRKLDTMDKLRSIHPAAPEFPAVFQDAFQALDADNSGTLDTDEARAFMRLLLAGTNEDPGKKPSGFANIMLEIRKFQDPTSGAFTEAAFTDALIHILTMLGMASDDSSEVNSRLFVEETKRDIASGLDERNESKSARKGISHMRMRKVMPASTKGTDDEVQGFE